MGAVVGAVGDAVGAAVGRSVGDDVGADVGEVGAAVPVDPEMYPGETSAPRVAFAYFGTHPPSGLKDQIPHSGKTVHTAQHTSAVPVCTLYPPSACMSKP